MFGLNLGARARLLFNLGPPVPVEQLDPAESAWICSLEQSNRAGQQMSYDYVIMTSRVSAKVGVRPECSVKWSCWLAALATSISRC